MERWFTSIWNNRAKTNTQNVREDYSTLVLLKQLNRKSGKNTESSPYKSGRWVHNKTIHKNGILSILLFSPQWDQIEIRNIRKIHTKPSTKKINKIINIFASPSRVFVMRFLRRFSCIIYSLSNFKSNTLLRYDESNTIATKSDILFHHNALITRKRKY